MKKKDTRIRPKLYSSKEVIGNHFGNLIALKRVPGKDKCLCLCDCGREFVTYISNIIRGKTSSCGCLRQKHPGPKHHNWGGGRFVASNGYIKIYVPDHPKAYGGRYMSEHTIVMESMLGRYLFKGENVHHKNGDRTDNRPENLELWVKSQPPGQRPEDLVKWAKEILEKYDKP